MNSTVLSGEQLVTAQSRTEFELPAVGVKDFRPSNSWLESKQIQSALDSRKELLELERVEKWSGLMHARWQPDKRKAAVIDKGKPWEVFGHHSDNGDWLFAEEVLLLMEMNQLECLFGEIPLSIQRGYSVLLSPDNGCSLDEYRVFAHLCRAGYRVVRHLPDLTVTAYERQVRLDQHLDQRATYETSQEQAHPRPDLPPKKIVDLLEGGEITIESPGPPLKTEPEKTKPKGQIEIIDLADTSSESSDESSDDSDIEIVHVSGPTTPSLPKVEVPMEDDDDLEIIEVPVPPKEIIVATIDSSDSESDDDRSYDGNWKRKSDKSSFVRPDSMKNFTFSAVDEFCSERIKNDKLIDANVPKNNETSNQSNKESVDTATSEDFLSFSDSQTESNRSNVRVVLSRTEILDLMPTMYGQRGKLMTLDSPDPNLIPTTVNPKNKSYTYNMSTLRAKTYSTNFRGYFRGRRNFHGPRFNSYGPYQNTVSNFSNPLAIGNGLLPLPQAFGSDVQSVARGMMQFASALLMNMSHNRPDNRLIPFNHHQNLPFSHHRDSPHFHNSPPAFIEPPRNFNTPTHTRFSDSPINSISPNLTGTNDNLINRSFETDYNAHSRSSGTGSDFDSREQTFSPPCNRRFNKFNRFSRSRGCLRSRNNSNQNRSILPAPRNFTVVDPNFPNIDPAYVKPDIPIDEGQVEKEGGFIPFRTSCSKSAEVIEIVDLDKDPPGRGRGRGRFETKAEKRKRKKRLRFLMSKKFCLNQRSGPAPEVVFLDSPVSETTLKYESDNSSVNIKAEGNVAVKEESVPVEINAGAQIKNETLDSREIKVESRTDTVVKSEGQASTSSSGVRVNIGQDCSGTNLLVEIKIEGSSEVSSRTTPTVIKTESDKSVKTEPDSSSEVQTANVKNEPVDLKTEPGSLGLKKENSVEKISPDQRFPQNPTSNPEELLAEVSSTSALVDSSGLQQENITSESTEMEVESTEGDVPAEEISEQCEVLKDSDRCEMVVEASEDSDRTNNNESEMVVEEDQSKTNVEANAKSKIMFEGTKDYNIVSSDNNQISGISDVAMDKSDLVQTPDHLTQETMDTQSETSIERASGDVKIVHENVDSCEMDVDVQNQIASVGESTSKSEETSRESVKNPANSSCWAEVKKHSVPLTSRQENEDEKKATDDEDENEVRPLIKPSDCRTMGSVLAALQIFSSISQAVPEDTPKLKISFDLYLATDFKKSNRGLPHYRIVVFSGSEPMPSPAQVREVNSRFQDSVPVLRAVVMPNSVVFYKAADISLPVDDTNYTE